LALEIEKEAIAKGRGDREPTSVAVAAAHLALLATRQNISQSEVVDKKKGHRADHPRVRQGNERDTPIHWVDLVASAEATSMWLWPT
jgi:hypothetical protein